MNESDQLLESCRLLCERSDALRERSEQEQAHCAEQHALDALLYQRCRDARAEAQHIRSLVKQEHDSG